MTIHRVGGPANKPSRRDPLGKVLVTIDDLAALFQLLQASQPERPVTVKFNGGRLDDPNDIRELSDGELSFLTVESNRALVYLGPDTATTVCPDAKLREKIVHWSSTRQTTTRPPRVPRKKSPGTSKLEIFVPVAAVLAVLILPIAKLLNLPFYPAPLIAAALSVTFVSACMGALLSLQLIESSPPKTYAIILPQSIKEYRDRKQSEKHPKRANTIATVALVIGAAGVGVAIWAIFAQAASTG